MPPIDVFLPKGWDSLQILGQFENFESVPKFRNCPILWGGDRSCELEGVFVERRNGIVVVPQSTKLTKKKTKGEGNR